MSNTLTRRTAITAALATAAAPAVAAMPTSGEDAELLELGRQFEIAFKPWLAQMAVDCADHNAFQKALRDATGGVARKGPRNVETESGEFVPNPDPAVQAYWATFHRMHDERSDDISDEEREDLTDPLWELAEEILEFRPKTVVGFGILTRAMMFCFGTDWSSSPDSLSPEEWRIINFIEAAAAFAGVDMPAEITAEWDWDMPEDMPDEEALAELTDGAAEAA
jgi:hypothetical protein